MNIIVAVNNDWGIGLKGTQQIIIPEDRQHFIMLTRGGVVISGRKTFEDCGGPLPGRKNILLTRDKDFTAEGVVTVNSIKQAVGILADGDDSKTFVIGGGEVYKLFLPICEYAYITKINASPVSDTFFPNLDEMSNWSIEHTSMTYEHHMGSNDDRKVDNDQKVGDNREASDDRTVINYVFAVYKNNAVEKPTD